MVAFEEILCIRRLYRADNLWKCTDYFFDRVHWALELSLVKIWLTAYFLDNLANWQSNIHVSANFSFFALERRLLCRFVKNDRNEEKYTSVSHCFLICLRSKKWITSGVSIFFERTIFKKIFYIHARYLSILLETFPYNLWK